MLTKLVFPPQWIPTQPYLSLPSLTAYLKVNGCIVEQMDVNIAFYDHLLSKEGIKPYFERVRSLFEEMDSGNELPPALRKQYTYLGISMLFGEFVMEQVDKAKEILRDREMFYDFRELQGAFKKLELGLKLASCAYYPTNLTFHAYDMRYSCRSSKDVLEAINDRKENLFIDYFEKITVPEILKDKPGLVGISIINTSQLIPGLTLANLIKRADEKIHINIGGSVFTRLIDELGRNHDLFTIFDSVIVHEGESALLGLIRHLKGEIGIRDIPNLIYRDKESIGINKIHSLGEDINSLPTPYFDGFPLDRYFSPELIIPLLSSRGCYWKRCTFCDHSYGYSGKYRPRDVDMLYQDIEHLKKKYNTSFFTFQDEGLSPKLIGELSEKLIKNRLNITWLADSRFETAFTADIGRKTANAGCTMLYFGLESASDRILKCMDKGINKDNVRRICKLCADAGIWTHLFLIFGFPTETKQEAKETMDFIMANSKFIRSMSFGSFQLTRHSKVHEDPEFFGVSNVVKDRNLDLSLWYDYRINRGMTKKETEDTINEFYSMLSRRYRDTQIWSNLDREHLFLYISHFKGAGKVPDLSSAIDMSSGNISGGKTSGSDGFLPRLNEGVFMGSFGFNLAKMHHMIMTGDAMKEVMRREATNVLFDTNNNRIYTVPDFGRDMLAICRGEMNLSEIAAVLMTSYKISQEEAESRCMNLLKGLIERNIVVNGNRKG